MRFWKILLRSARLKCPRCGRGNLFRSWFAMHPRCPHCDLKYQQEDGYFLGSIYVNYGVTALILVIGYPLLAFVVGLPSNYLLVGGLAFCLLFPLWFFRYARSIWLGFDLLFDPSGMESERNNSH